jgi:benzoylformate decarboxylase
MSVVKMNGTEAFLDLLRACGVTYLFGNPGHTELPMLDALADRPDMHYVLGLNEAVSMAMADGYAMASGKLGVFCSHITPGFGNALGMLYDASKTRAPLLVVGGQQDGRFSFTEPALWGDMVSLARPLTKWAYQVERIEDLTPAMRRAIKLALTPPTGPVFLALPSHVLRGTGEFDLTPPTLVSERVRGDRAAIARACDVLCAAERPLIVAGDEVGKSGAEPELTAIAALLGAAVYSEPSSNTFNFPTDHPTYQGTLARLQSGVRGVLDKADALFAVGADVFTMATYADLDPMPPGLRLVQLNADTWQLGKNYPPEVAIWGDPKATLAEMVSELTARADARLAERAHARIAALAERRVQALGAVKRQVTMELPKQPTTGNVVLQALVASAPDDAVVVDESNTAGLLLRAFLYERKLAYFGLKGGGLGWGLPASVGVAFAMPDRPVLSLLGDGGAMYTVQALWTAAHQRTRVVFVICNNAQYRIVKHRLHAYGGAAARTRTYLGVDLRDPAIDFVALARSLGVWATRVDTGDGVPKALAEALGQNGPALLDLTIEGSYPEHEAGA